MADWYKRDEAPKQLRPWLTWKLAEVIRDVATDATLLTVRAGLQEALDEMPDPKTGRRTKAEAREEYADCKNRLAVLEAEHAIARMNNRRDEERRLDGEMEVVRARMRALRKVTG